jgi:polar amino acid transport system substrate-binding protein
MKSRIVISIAFWIFYCDFGHSKAARNLPTVIINNTNWQPFFFTGIGAPKGLGGEVLELCLPEAGYKPGYVNNSIKRMYKGLEDGTIDLNIFSYKKEREGFLFYSKVPLFKSEYKPFIRVDSKIKIRKISDFDKYKLGHRPGLRYSAEFHNYVKKRQALNSVDEADLDSLNIKKLIAGKIDIFVNTAATTHWVAKEMGLSKEIKEVDYTIQSSDYFLTISKKSVRIRDKKAFLKSMDSCFRRIKKDGTFTKIVNKYRL